MAKVRLARKPTPASGDKFDAWQAEIAANQSPDFQIDPRPSIQVVAARLMYIFQAASAPSELHIPPSLLVPIRLETHGLRITQPFSHKYIARLALSFEKYDDYTEQRRELLMNAGLRPHRIRDYQPLLPIGTINVTDLDVESLAKNVLAMPASLEFAPLELEEYGD